ncbi:hypothetical protein Tco_0367495 [Tanacetum coccineum]
MDWGEVNPVHAYYNGSCTSKDNEDPSWSTSFKTRRTQKTSSALEVLWKTLFLLYLYLIGTFFFPFLFCTTSYVIESNREGPEEAKGAKAGLSFTIMLVNAKIHSVGTPLRSPEVKNVLKRSRWETTIHQAGGSGDGTGSKPGVPNEPKGKSIDTNEWTSL